ncbi:MAG: DNA methyltransferase [Bradymonadia bacterium]
MDASTEDAGWGPSVAQVGEGAPTGRLMVGDCVASMRALARGPLAGRVKCAYLDPPYNGRVRRAHYDDDLDSEVWRAEMRDCLEALVPLLAPDAVVWAHIDDAESAYLKVLMDEVFGRQHHLVTLYVQVRSPQKTLTEDRPFHNLIEHVHGYGVQSPRLYRPQEPYDLSRFVWRFEWSAPSAEIELGGRRVQIFRPEDHHARRGPPGIDGLKEVWASGAVLDGNSSGRFFRDHLMGRVALDGLGAVYRVEGIGEDGLPWRVFAGPRRQGAVRGRYFQGVPEAVRHALEQGEHVGRVRPVSNLIDMARAFGNCRHEGGVPFRAGKKPERLLMSLLELATAPGDWVLDAFGGSGTTAAVAHKMGRRWVIMEQGPQWETHILPRLSGIVAGEDSTGVTEVTGWAGGGAFSVHSLGCVEAAAGLSSEPGAGGQCGGEGGEHPGDGRAAPGAQLGDQPPRIEGEPGDA